MQRGIAILISWVVLTPGIALAGWADSMFDAQQHDFGQNARGTRLQHSFVFTNTGEKDAQIQKINVSCGCVKASATAQLIRPGESTTIDAVMDTSVFQGAKTVTIHVQFDRPKRTEVALRVTCVSVGDLSRGNNEADFGVVAAGGKGEKRLNLDFANNGDWKILGLDFGSPHLKADVQEISRDAKKVRYELRIELLPTAPAGAFEDRIRIKTNDRAAAEITVIARARIEGKIVVSPETLRFTGISAGEKASRNLIIKAQTPFRVLRAENTHGMFEIKASPTTQTTQLVVVTLTMPDDSATVPEHVELLTDLPGDHTITVPVQR